MRKTMYISMIVLVCVTAFLGRSHALAAPSNVDSTNLLFNGGFEAGDFSPTGSPDHWSRSWTQFAYDPSSVLLWDDTEAHEGKRSIKVIGHTPQEVMWIQTVSVQPHTNYWLSGWIKTQAVSWASETVTRGANLSILDTKSSTWLIGTNDWTYVSVVFNSGERSEVTVAAQLGFWAGTTGIAWFDDLEITPIPATAPHPAWKILVLIYDKTDFTYIDPSGVSHHYLGMMTQEEKDQAELAATKFVEEDIPALDSGNMIPTLTIRHPDQALTKLTPSNPGWWPTPSDVDADRDPAFDSVIVLWDPEVLDEAIGETTTLAGWAGITANMGLGQTYTAIILDAATWYGHRNVFKHEWGHSITIFYDAYGIAPKPAVNNHINDTDIQYVHCPTGEEYILVDESDANPIPNSIYNNETGFTHDYYSGTTATPDQPTRCLGITPETWAAGGPVSKPIGALSPIQQLQSIKDNVDKFVLQGDLPESHAKSLYAKLDAANKALEGERDKAAVKSLQIFVKKVEGLMKAERLPEAEGLMLIDQATTLINQLKN